MKAKSFLLVLFLLMRMAEELQKSKWRGCVFRYAPLILWIGVIFLLSSGQGSMTQTSRFIRPLLKFLFPTAPEEVLLTYHGYIRKFAHFAEYAVLAFWAWRTFADASSRVLQRFWWLFALGVVVLVASLDEFNQSFNTQRTSSVYDVLIDISGGLAMILFLALFGKYVKNFEEKITSRLFKKNI